MEKNYYSLILVFLLTTQMFFAQEPLCVLKATAEIFSSNSPSKALRKGTLVNAKDVVTLQKGSSLSLINKKGELYKVEQAGKYSYNQLVKHKVENDKSSLTSKYLEYLWEEMTQSAGSETIIGGVFRGENLMRYPIDSSLISGSKITFKWDIDSLNTSYYIFIKNIETNTMLKIVTNGSMLSLYKDNPIFSEGTDFEWYVDTEAFPNLDNKTFYIFSLIDRNTYQNKKEEYKDFTSDLKTVGLTDQEIEEILCETYGLCK